MTTLRFNDFPFPLQNIPDPPKQLYILGDPKILFATKIIAIVGTRQITDSGKEITTKLTKEFVESGFVIISGMALGIDAIAHQTAIDCCGKTIAVLGAGINVVYPMAHKNLYNRIVENGAIISEHPPGKIVPRNIFAARNRIISGLSQGVIIPECNLRSGSMVTARLALDQGKDVFVVPGSPGTDFLAEQGACQIC